MRQKTQTTSVCVGPEVKMVSTESLIESGFFSNVLKSVTGLGEINGKVSKRNKQEEEYLRSTCKYRKNNVQRHSYVFNEYVPDFENGCYRLQFRCEYCGNEVFDKVNDGCEGNYDGWKQTDTSEVVTRYSKKRPNLPVVCIQRIKLRGAGLFIPSIRTKEVRFQ